MLQDAKFNTIESINKEEETYFLRIKVVKNPMLAEINIIHTSYEMNYKNVKCSKSVKVWDTDKLDISKKSQKVSIGTILNSYMKIRSLTSYWESNKIEKTSRDQCHPGFSNDNETTNFLWIREQQDGIDRQRSVPFQIPQWLPLTFYKWESNKSGTDNQISALIWIPW